MRLLVAKQVLKLYKYNCAIKRSVVLLNTNAFSHIGSELFLICLFYLLHQFSQHVKLSLEIGWVIFRYDLFLFEVKNTNLVKTLLKTKKYYKNILFL